MFAKFVAIAVFAGFSFAAIPANAGDDTAALWKKKCSKCHGMDGKAATKMGKKMAVADMTTDEWQKRFDDETIKKATVEGIKRTVDGKKQKMKGYKKLTPEQLTALTEFIRGLAQPAS